MITIRQGVFESNSSSMHCLTVKCAQVDNKQYVKDNIDPFKTEDGNYYIKIKLNDENLDNGSFSIRHYIPHYTLNDKLMYLYATVVQHFSADLISGPTEPYRFSFEKDATGLSQRRAKYEEELKMWQQEGVQAINDKVINQFKKYINELERSLERNIRRIVFGPDPKSHWDDVKGVSVLDEPDKRPEITVELVYFIQNGNIIPADNVEDFEFSTGCYGNEEFFYSACSNHWDAIEWLLNPYCVVLAGGDEMDEEDYLAQRKEAKRLMDDSWMHYISDYIKNNPDLDFDEDHKLILNPAKVVWPLGG